MRRAIAWIRNPRGGWNVSLPTAAVCLETLEMIVITPPHIMRFPERGVTPGWGKKNKRDLTAVPGKAFTQYFRRSGRLPQDLSSLLTWVGIFISSTAGMRPRTLQNSKNHSKTGKSWKETFCWLFAGVWNTLPLCWHTLIVLCIRWHLGESGISRDTYTHLWVLFFGVKCSRINLRREDCGILHLLAQMHDCVMTEGTSA